MKKYDHMKNNQEKPDYISGRPSFVDNEHGQEGRDIPYPVLRNAYFRDRMEEAVRRNMVNTKIYQR